MKLAIVLVGLVVLAVGGLAFYAGSIEIERQEVTKVIQNDVSK